MSMVCLYIVLVFLHQNRPEAQVRQEQNSSSDHKTTADEILVIVGLIVLQASRPKPQTQHHSERKRDQ